MIPKNFKTLLYIVSKESEVEGVRDKCKQSPQHACQLICASHGWCMDNSLIFYAVTVNLRTYESFFESVTRKEEFPFQLISETYEVVTGKGEFLFQQFLERENGELVFPEVLFSEAGHQATQLPATHYSTSRSHPTAGNFAKSLIDWRVQGKGMYC